MSDVDIHKLTGAYAVDALDELERARFEQHLAGCEDCRAEVAELTETAALLAETTAVTPPPSLRDSVLTGISQVRPLPPEVPRIPVAPAGSTSATTDSRSGGRRWMPFLVAAAVALLLGIGAAVVQPWSPDRGSLTAAEQVLQAGDAQNVSLDLGDAGKATVTRSKSHDEAVIVTDGMQEAPAGKVYQLWLMSPEGKFTPAGLMPDEADQTMLLEGHAANAAAVGITVEPDGGSPQPTTNPIAMFDLENA
jgi:anti-sigma-K factor RskA